MDSWVGRLLELVLESSKVQDLAVGREEARLIGDEINRAGGFDLMREVAHMSSDLGKQQGQPFSLGYIERWWDGIGSWRS